MNNNTNKREFKRFPVDFSLEVSAKDIEENEYNDRGALENISGGGAKFTTRQPAKYFSGQSLETTISLPGTDDVKAYMKGKATVMRVDSPNDSDVGEKSKGAGIAIRFDAPLKMYS